jgi:uncharacterized membrane protein YkoI
MAAAKWQRKRNRQSWRRMAANNKRRQAKSAAAKNGIENGAAENDARGEHQKWRQIISQTEAANAASAGGGGSVSETDA